MAAFEQALKKLMEDQNYRNLVVKEPQRLTQDYKLGVKDLLVLMQVWDASGHPEALSIINLCHCCCGFS